MYVLLRVHILSSVKGSRVWIVHGYARIYGIDQLHHEILCDFPGSDFPGCDTKQHRGEVPKQEVMSRSYEMATGSIPSSSHL